MRCLQEIICASLAWAIGTGLVGSNRPKGHQEKDDSDYFKESSFIVLTAALGQEF